MSKPGSNERSRQLARRLRSLRKAARNLPDGVILLDSQGRIRWHNQAAENLLDIDQVRHRRKMLAEIIDSGPIGDWLRDAGDVPLEATAPGQPGVHLQLSRIELDSGHGIISVRDISHLVRLEKVRRDFVANVSHELRTPLTVIHGYLELLEPDEIPALAPVLAEMRLQSRRMSQIVEDLLTLSRLEVQRDLEDEPIAMQPLLGTLRKEALALSQERHVVRLAEDGQWDLVGSPEGLHSAFSNLVSNAVRYTPAGGSITISWRATADGAEFAVSDSGYGIPADHLSRLTERFYRVSTSRSRELGGTGLGLSIVKHVLMLHHASLRIESKPGLGSTFTCVFDRSRLRPRGEPTGTL